MKVAGSQLPAAGPLQSIEQKDTFVPFSNETLFYVNTTSGNIKQQNKSCPTPLKVAI